MTDYQTLTFDEYRSLLTLSPCPTDQQIDAFIEFFVESHSWYKHLPLLPERRAFSFYLNPTAGYSITEDMDGNIVVSEKRQQDTDKFHHTWMPTVDYHEQYASWSYMSARSSADSVPDNKTCFFDNFRKPHIYARTGVAYCLPSEVLQAGSVQLDRLIHPYSAQESWIDELLEENIDWSSEVGGNELLAKIRDRLRVIETDGIVNYSPDSELSSLVKPIVNVYIEEIRAAMFRVRALIAGSAV